MKKELKIFVLKNQIINKQIQFIQIFFMFYQSILYIFGGCPRNNIILINMEKTIDLVKHAIPYTQDDEKYLLKDQNLKLIKEDTWFLTKKQFSYKNGQRIFTACKVAYPRKLSLCYDYDMLDNNNQQKILLSLQNTEFPKLKQLDLRYNSITSIEIMQRIYMPLLQKLSLKHNNINSLTVLRKCHFPKLSYINLHRNYIHDVQPLCEVLNDDNFSMTVQLEQLLSYNNIDESLDWIAKLPKFASITINMKGIKRISKNCYLAILSKKFKYTSIAIV